MDMCFVQALAGPHFYTWGDHGGILMAIAQGGSSKTLKSVTVQGSNVPLLLVDMLSDVTKICVLSSGGSGTVLMRARPGRSSSSLSRRCMFTNC